MDNSIPRSHRTTGEDIDPEAAAHVHEGHGAREYRLTPLTSYRSDGRAFTNDLLVEAVQDDRSAALLIGMQPGTALG